VTAVDLAVARRFDLILRLVSGRTTPEKALDVLDPRWRHRHKPTVEVFTAPDGLPGLRLSDDAA